MPSRWESFCLAEGIRRSGIRRTLLLAFLCVLTGLSSSPALATLTLTIAEPYGISDNKVYLTSDPAATVDTAKSFANFDLTSSQDDASPDLSQALYLQLDSSSTFSVSGDQRLVVAAFAKTAVNGSRVAVPIATLNDVTCYGTVNSGCLMNLAGTNFYRQVQSTSSTSVTSFRIRIFPKDICSALSTVSSGSDLGQGCTGAAVTAPTASSVVSMNIVFAIGVVANSTTALTFDAATEKSAETTFSWYAKAPTFTCPSLATAYFPGDKGILVTTDVAVSTDAFAAPVTTLIVAAEKSSAVDTSAITAAMGSDIVARLGLSSGLQYVGGFENTTTGADNAYGIAFSVRDASGRLADFSSGCAISGVQTSEVQGFLGQSNCFIATAAHGSAHHAGVTALRAFRDRILSQWGPGRAFVAAYGRASPKAASWLRENPSFRWPVLLLLAPVQAFATLSLIPGLLPGLAVLAALGVLAFWLPRGRKGAHS